MAPHRPAVKRPWDRSATQPHHSTGRVMISAGWSTTDATSTEEAAPSLGTTSVPGPASTSPPPAACRASAASWPRLPAAAREPARCRRRSAAERALLAAAAKLAICARCAASAGRRQRVAAAAAAAAEVGLRALGSSCCAALHEPPASDARQRSARAGPSAARPAWSSALLSGTADARSMVCKPKALWRATGGRQRSDQSPGCRLALPAVCNAHPEVQGQRSLTLMRQAGRVS